MNNIEFSNEFDVLYNNITSNQAPGIDEYEKSVFLTKAQYDILKNYFDPRGNKFQEGFDGSKKRQADFTNLIRTKVLEELSIDNDLKFDRRSRCYSIPNDLFLPINEKYNNSIYNFVVSPISYQEYDTLMLKPYQYPVKRQVWRLFTDKQSPVTVTTTDTIEGVEYKYIFTNSSDKKVTFKLIAVLSVTEEKAPIINETSTTVEIICNIARENFTSSYWIKFRMNNNPDLIPYLGDLTGSETSNFPSFRVPQGYSITIEIEPSTFVIELIGKVPEDVKYTMRYLVKPKPIILVDLDEGLSIEGISTETNCELDPQIHYEIVQRAVELAKAAYTGDLNSQLALGQTSQTNIGAIQTRE